ncbi:MAG: amino acid ABC transporter permease [Candidatus Dormibacteraeota bacterium]|nr:amino acid ABC transporter permease [Candidatus Dormibacteraeota bacterium]
MVPASTDRRERRSRILGGRRGVVASTTSTLLVIALLGFLVLLAPGSAEVRHTFFSLNDMRRALIGDPQRGLFSVAGGLVLNIEMFLIAEVLILVLALVIAVIRQLHTPALLPIRLLAVAYTDFFRGVPLILVIYAMGFGLPALNIEVISTQEPVVYGVAALVLSYAAYVSEVYRAGIDSVHPSQAAAARSLGLTEWHALRFVVIPQAVRRVVPPLLNDFISLQKDTALVAVLGVIEANRAAGIYSSTVFNYSGYTVAALLFLVLTVPLARFTDYLVATDRRKRHGEVAA